MFRDREDAAQQLAQRLKERELRDPLVLGIPRGGVVIGAVLARELGGELDVVLSRKLRAPFQPELAVGAVSEDGAMYINRTIQKALKLKQDYFIQERDYQLAEIARRKQLFRAVRPVASATGRSVIVTDDGIATGSTMIAALHTMKAQHPHELIVAVPVAPPERLAEIQRLCDHVISLLVPPDFEAVGQFYEDFGPVEDDQAAELLQASVSVPRKE